MIDAYRRFILLLVLLAPAPAALAQESLPIFDESVDRTSGSFVPPDSLLLDAGDRMPLHTESAAGGAVSGLLRYRHTEGAWEMQLGADASDITGFDTLVVFLNGPDSISGGELPRVGLQDASGARSSLVWLSRLMDVRVDEQASGFVEERNTQGAIRARYSDALPSEHRRPGYPEDLTVTFASVPLDTSSAGIGAPEKPAKFKIVTASGLRADFRLRDTDNDSTLSRTGEYIEILLPESPESDRLLPVWRLTYDTNPLTPPVDGDVYRLVVDFDEVTLDADPGTWQRVTLPVTEFTGDFSRTEFQSVVVVHGSPTDATRTLWIDRVTLEKNDDASFLALIQEKTFQYFWQEANPANGLVKDRSTPGSPASIAAMGFGLSAVTVGVDRGWITHEQGRTRVLNTLRSLWNAPQSQAVDATGYKGFFYHFLDMSTGQRAWNSELSTIDSALLLGGVLHVREYFREDDEIRDLGDAIYERVDWTWMQRRHATNPTAAISHGWRPESGFIQNDWYGYNEAMILYILALGSPTHPVGSDSWDAWVGGYGSQWQTQYGFTFLTFPPLFGHQYSHVWIDFRGIQDEYMRGKGIDYFENSRRATLAQRAYHIANPREWPNYSEDEWGLTASDTPVGYRARGAPPAQNDDGTLVPTGPGGSIVFTPEESIAALRTMHKKYPNRLWGPYGFRDAYNVSMNWFGVDYIGIDQGPILLMIENHLTERIWEEFMQNEAVLRGLEGAGFILPTSAEDEVLRNEIILDGNYPNPLYAETTIKYYLPISGQVRVEIYDVLGRLVGIEVDAFKTAGSHEAAIDARHLAPGIYFYALRHGQISRTGTMMVVR